MERETRTLMISAGSKFCTVILGALAGLGVFLALIATQTVGVNISTCNRDEETVSAIHEELQTFVNTFFEETGKVRR